MKTKDLSQIYYVDSMLREAEFYISAERLSGEKLIKLLCHSPYAVNKLRQALRRLQREGKIVFWIKGGSFCPTDEGTRYLLDRFPEEINDDAMGAGNDFYSIVCLCVQ